MMLSCDRHDCAHVGRLSIEMNRNDADGGRCDLSFDFDGINRKVSSSVSQNTTRPPACVIVSDVEIQECAEVMTSSPRFKPSPLRAM
jgi:hypothetical protein